MNKKLTVRISLAQRQRVVNFFTYKYAYIYDLYKGKLLKRTKGQIHLLWHHNGITINTTKYQVKAILIISTERKTMFKGKWYRGEMLVIRTWNGLEIINRVFVEDYLKGVIKREISPEWPVEALKAQVIIARTYAIFNTIANRDKTFHMYDSTLSQVYGGINAETYKTSFAVDTTRGIIIVTKSGKLFQPFYSACCGGHTESPQWVWEQTDKGNVMKGTFCPYCLGSPYYQWEYAIKIKSFISKLRLSHAGLTNIDTIFPFAYTPSGRVHLIQVSQHQLKTVIKATKIRKAIGYNLIKSTLFSIYKDNTHIVFKGKGWGHGVGLCQWGARGMSCKGYNFKNIISFYFYNIKFKQAY